MEIKKVFAKNISECDIVKIEVAPDVFARVQIENVEIDEIQVHFLFMLNNRYLEVAYWHNSEIEVYLD